MADDPKPVDLTALATALAARHGGDATKALEKLIDENHDLREKNRGLKVELTTAQAQAPKEGAVVLVGKDAESYAAYQKLGAPQELVTKLAAGDAALAQVAADRLRATMATAATAAQYTAPGAADVLADLAQRPDKGFVVEVRDETVDGKAVKVPYARSATDEKAAWAKLPEFLQQHHAAYVPALTAAAGQTGTGTAAAAGRSYVTQAGGGTPAAPTNMIDALLARNAEQAKAPNALRPAPVVTAAA